MKNPKQNLQGDQELTQSAEEYWNETSYFPGSENPITYSRTYTLNFLCIFELQRYPFDTQICKLKIGPTHKQLSFVKLIPDKLQYLRPVEMLTYSVVDYQIGESDHGLVVVTVWLKRMVSRYHRRF